mgnify:CR=1 FL=1
MQGTDELSIDMNVKITGGKYKHCVGVLKEINNAFCKVDITRNEKKDITFQPSKLQKVKKTFIISHPESLIVEMPTEDNLKVVEHFPDENPDILNMIETSMKDKEIESKITAEIKDVPDPVLEVGEEVTENHVIRKTLTMDEANKLDIENKKLKEHLATYQHYKVDEIIRELADLRVDYKNLYEEWSAKDTEITRLNKLLSK